ncbi:hypothetical protein BO99DRAFT_466732 [Aspergillus violaceofuscus CBS 115571]|uniref:Uncharacterized protein n=1 Tax=Aspergillus violaceofuscus (strain CBS 115571) TaxID=1450538 RepID=A0A2V5GWU3_ASPV1|nr:hypothetical protein BO99DRAFT_466732 [Aspergillus violaceofuscus CBS 115571]
MVKTRARPAAPHRTGGRDFGGTNGSWAERRGRPALARSPVCGRFRRGVGPVWKNPEASQTMWCSRISSATPPQANRVRWMTKKGSRQTPSRVGSKGSVRALPQSGKLGIRIRRAPRPEVARSILDPQRTIRHEQLGSSAETRYAGCSAVGVEVQTTGDSSPGAEKALARAWGLEEARVEMTASPNAHVGSRR